MVIVIVYDLSIDNAYKIEHLQFSIESEETPEFLDQVRKQYNQTFSEKYPGYSIDFELLEMFSKAMWGFREV